MTLTNRYSSYVYFLSIILAMMLRIAPWPHDIRIISPDWVLLVIIYWSLAVPERVGIFNAWVIGLFTDVLTGRLLGQYALAYSISSFFCVNKHKRLRQFSPFQQGLFIYCVLQLSQFVIFWSENLQGPTAFQPAFWIPSLTGTACWPLVYTVLRNLRSGHQSD